MNIIQSSPTLKEELCEIIENAMIKGNKNIMFFAKSISDSILSKMNLNQLHQLLEEIMKNKEIYFIRHAQAEHNAYNQSIKNHMNDFMTCTKKDFFDPGLTQVGVQQIKEISEQVVSTNFEALFISPLRRTIETAINLNCKCTMILSDLIREMLTSSNKNIGIPLSELKKKDLKMETKYITKERWWLDIDKDENSKEILHHQPEERELFKLRVCLFLLWIVFRREKKILIVSHSKVYKSISKKKIYNAHVELLNPERVIKRCMKIFKIIDKANKI